MGLLNKQTKKKVSIDFSEKAYQLLTEYTRKMNASNSALINFLVENFLSMSDEEKKQWTEFCFHIIKKENAVRVSMVDDFEIQAYNRKIERYSNLLDFFVPQSNSKVFNNMEKIYMENGYIIYPNDWIVIDYIDPRKCKYAGVVSVRNASAYNVPIFLFFCHAPINTLSEDDEAVIFQKCIEKYYDFNKIMAMQVTLAYDSEGRLLNGELWAKAPTIGIFQIAEYGKDHSYPYGAMVVLEDK